MLSRPALTLAALMVAAPLVRAQVPGSPPVTSTGAADGGDYVVTASRAPEAIGRSVRPVQVITAEDLRASGAVSLTDVLRTLGGAEISTNGGLGQVSSVYLRGANGDHTVVLVDGVRIGSATVGTAPLESLPLALIERIEVLPGSSSSLYGADAIGGVIQIFTKSARRSPGLDVAATYGTHRLRQLSAAYGQRMGETEIAAAASGLWTEGYNSTTPANAFSYNPDPDGLRQRSLNVRATQHLSAEQQVSLQWLRADNDVHYDDGPDGDTYAVNRTQSLAAHWTGAITAPWQTELRLARAWDDAQYFSAFPGTVNTRQDQLSWLHRVALSGGTVTAGLEWMRQAVDSDTAYVVTSRSIRSLLLGWRAHYGAMQVQADLRHDDNSQFGDHTTGQLGAAWQIDPSWRLRVAAGTAFKAPSFNLLYYPGFGNPDLKPERSTSYELGLDGQWRAWTLGATWFDNRMRDLIDYAPPTYAADNIGRAGNRGLSLSAQAQLGDATRLKLNLTMQDPQNRDTGAQLRRRAREFGGVQLSHQVGAVRVGGDWTAVGQRFDSADEAPSSRMGGYSLVGLFARWQFQTDWTLEGRVNNLADKAYDTALGYRTPGREAQLTLRWTPGL